MDLQQNSDISFTKFAEQTLPTVSPDSISRYAINSLLELVKRENTEILNTSVINLWLASMILNGKKISTGKRYLSKISSIYSEYANSTDIPFKSIREALCSLSESGSKEASENLKIVDRLLTKTEKSEDWQTVCIFFYLLYNPAVSIPDVVNLTFKSAPRFCPQIDDIINSFDASHGRKYVFSLKQGKFRPHEISRNVSKQLLSLLSAAGMKFADGFSRKSITAIWIAAALKAEIDIREIKACLQNIPKEYEALKLIQETDTDRSIREDLVCKVADSINSCTKRWFVMKLRHGVDVADIESRIKETLPNRHNTMMLYYPTRTEIRKEGRKRIIETHPYLQGILFFKTEKNRVRSLFANIGDLAWCFKTSNTPNCDYATIPHSQMTAFQRYVGQFSEDIKMELVDIEHPLEKGRKVRVVGGVMAGYEGEIIDVEDEPGKRIFFLSLTDSKRAKWTAHVEDHLIEPL